MDRAGDEVVSEQSFQPGAVVKLMSGSALVTVIEVMPEKGAGSRELCRVMWFEAGKFSETLIPSAALRSVAEKVATAVTLHVCSRDRAKGDSLAVLVRCGRPEEYRAKDPFGTREAYLCGECWSTLDSDQQVNYVRTGPALVRTITSTQDAAVLMSRGVASACSSQGGTGFVSPDDER